MHVKRGRSKYWWANVGIWKHQNSRTLSGRTKFVYPHLVAVGSNWYNEFLSTVAFTMSRSNFNNFGSKNSKNVARQDFQQISDFGDFPSGLLHAGGPLKLVQLRLDLRISVMKTVARKSSIKNYVKIPLRPISVPPWTCRALPEFPTPKQRWVWEEIGITSRMEAQFEAQSVVSTVMCHCNLKSSSKYCNIIARCITPRPKW